MKKWIACFMLLNACVVTDVTLWAKVTMPFIFSDHMVIQRDKPINVWGWAGKREHVKVTFNGKEYETKADAKGNWSVEMEALPAGGGTYEMQVKGEENELKFSDILMGDVWLCSGQSNMEFRMEESPQAKEDVAKASNPNIRLFFVERKMSYAPLDNYTAGTWKNCSPETVAKFTAVGYYFGKYVQEEIGVPIGLIDCAWGGTDIQTWTSWGVMSKDEKYARYAGKSKKQIDRMREQEKENYFESIKNDRGIKEKWYRKDMTGEEGWKAAQVPGALEKTYPALDGVVWYQRTVDIPEGMTGEATLNLGAIDDRDITYVNGQQVGAADIFYQGRSYQIPAGVLKPGKNRITVKVTDTGGDGGFLGAPKDLFISIGNNRIELSGEWICCSTVNLLDLNYREMPFETPNDFASLLFNSMVNPITRYAIKGAIWYQGENNAGEAYKYRTMFTDMITDWRHQWGYEFPFYWVQLANYMDPATAPEESAWAELREAQHLALSLPQTGEAVIIDRGEAKDIHPKDKKTVGYRLALNAFAKTYGRNIEYSGPVYQSMGRQGDRIILNFTHTGSGLQAKGEDRYGYLKGFTIAGEDGKFVTAKAYISGDRVVVFSESVAAPVAVRYAWANNPDDANLYNREGLPASPFRTDDWALITQRK